MEIFSFVEKYFELLRTFQGWSLILLGTFAGLGLYHTLHNGELRELQLKDERLTAISQQWNLTGQELSSLQRTFLKELERYQLGHHLSKVIVSKDGMIFDDRGHKPTTVNVIESFLKKNKDTFTETDLEQLIYSIPEKYLRLVPETRFGSPFVLVTTNEVGKL
jgi:hypothetical protein